MASPVPWLRVFPPAVSFTNVEANTVYTCVVTLRNADTHLHTARPDAAPHACLFLVHPPSTPLYPPVTP